VVEITVGAVILELEEQDITSRLEDIRAVPALSSSSSYSFSSSSSPSRWYWSCIGCTDMQKWFNGNHLYPMQSACSGRQWLSIHISDDVGILTLMDVKIIPSKRALPYHLLSLV
jgi:hypothetical protein